MLRLQGFFYLAAKKNIRYKKYPRLHKILENVIRLYVYSNQIG
jgi:hypothetical protein